MQCPLWHCPLDLHLYTAGLGCTSPKGSCWQFALSNGPVLSMNIFYVSEGLPPARQPKLIWKQNLPFKIYLSGSRKPVAQGRHHVDVRK